MSNYWLMQYQDETALVWVFRNSVARDEVKPVDVPLLTESV